MKTFDEKDLITWSNRHNAKVGTKGYFAVSITDLNDNIKAGKIYELEGISDENSWCFTDGTFRYGFFLPVDAIKEEKIYRACRTVQELYELVFNTKSKADPEFYINELAGTVIHFRLKGFDSTVYGCITGIVVYINGNIAVHMDGRNFELDELFKNYKIKINGKWVPFGVEV